ncbi:MAG: 23S rRNA (adenine(2503)-C(2))-methyltransferase RlmN [Actinomycetota bacterium]|nr:23S rRNA (adenine(2503)-C(2))-methyltransferase RlmN [Actinomycetota bacterium]
MPEFASAYQIDPGSLGDLAPDHPTYRTNQLREWLYEHPVLEPAQMTNLPIDLRASLEGQLWPFTVEIEQSADDGRTRKWLFRTPDGASIESVLMGYKQRTTLCISSQAGCALACTFCATGQFGFERHLDAGEIVAQVAYANAALRANPLIDSPDRVTNVVFMGMGEPLANYKNVRESLHRLIDIIDMAARSVTVSTVGVVPGMRRLADEPWQVSLAVSLHAADDELRTSLVPLNQRYPLAEVVEAARYFFDETGRRISIEWTMMAGVNDTYDQAAGLARIAKSLQAHINVIAMNPTPLTPHRPPGRTRIDEFMDALAGFGANATFRQTRGQEIDAACGQLRVRSAIAKDKGAT